MIQVRCVRSEVVAQACITAGNAESTVKQKGFFKDFFKLRERLKESGSRIIRGLGDHHKIGWPGSYQGKIPEQ